MNTALYLRYAASTLILVLLATLSPAVALADAPGLRGPDTAPAGAVGSGEWSDIQALPPITGVPAPASAQTTADKRATMAGLPAATVYGQADQQPAASAAFSLRALYPGNWVMDAGLGIVSGAMQSIQETLLGFISAVSGVPAPTDTTPFMLGCNSSGLSILFCTKPEDVLPPNDLILQAPSKAEKPAPAIGLVADTLQKVWVALQPAALALLTIVFTVRLGRVMHAGPAAFQSEVKALLLPFLAACTIVAAAPALLRILLSFFAALNTAILSGSLLGLGKINIPFVTYVPTDFVGSLSLGPVYALLTLFVILFIAFVVALIRLAKLTVLLAIAPLAGATLIDRSTAPLFGNWLSKVIELLLHQLGWSVAALVGSAILSTMVPGATGTPTDGASFIVQTIGTALVLLFMLCQQQLFNGVFLLVAGGTSPVMGGAMNKVAGYMSMFHGVQHQNHSHPPHTGGSARGAKPAKTPPPPPPSRPPGSHNRHSSANTNSVASSQPGARARASAWRGNGSLAQRMNGMPMQRTHSAPSQPTAAQTVSVASLAPAPASTTINTSSYIAAGRARRRSGAATAIPAAPERTATIRRLQAQASQTGRQAWRAAPAALAREMRWGIVRPGSTAGQRALRELTQRPYRTRSEREAGAQVQGTR